MKYIWISVAVALACAATIYVAGIRIVVIQPIGAIPKGVTAIVAGVENVNFIDSPDAICLRRMGGVSLLCRGMTAAAIANNSKILARLPYSNTLFKLSGAPDLDR